tara:strand:- start:1400 stop:1804 length:405 start_codon:yes stop_codon:yes gene_type:complete
MKNYKNNFRRNRYKNHSDRNHQKNGNVSVLINDFNNGSNFQRKNHGRNNHNASKLIEKYSNLAREALSNGDKILSENYFQHAEHFIRVLEEKENSLNKNQIIKVSKTDTKSNDKDKVSEPKDNLEANNSNSAQK